MSEETAVIVHDGEQVDPSTGEVLPEKIAEEFKGYAGVATIQLSQEERGTLAEVLPPEEHDILPTGEVYVPQVHYRRRLNRVFGPGSWALVPRGRYVKQGKTLCREYALVARGCFISESTGESDYHESNERMSYASAAEAVKSNAIMRCCKDLGIGWECWDPRFCQSFKKEHCVKVWRESKPRPQWRRKDAEAWHDEKGQARPRGPEKGPKKTREPGEDDGEPPDAKPGFGCPYCGSGEYVTDSKGKTAVCSQCNKGWNLGR